MQEEPNPYSWQPLNLNALPKEKLCNMCGQSSHLLPINEHIVFWVHRGAELDKCTAVAFKTSYIKSLAAFIQEKTDRLDKQIVKDEEK